MVVGGAGVCQRWIRAGLAPPNAPLRQSAEFFRTFQLESISATSIAKARDAFAHLILELNHQQIAAYARADGEQPVFVSHVHDEVRESQEWPIKVASAGPCTEMHSLT